MTVSSASAKYGPLACDGATTTFSFVLQMQSPEDVQVVVTDALGIDASLTYETDYSVTLNADQEASPGGTVFLEVAPTTGHKVTILRNLSFTQSTALSNQGAFYPEVIEDSLDKLTMIAIQLQELQSRLVDAGSVTDVTVNMANFVTAASGYSSSAQGYASAASSSAANASASQASATLLFLQINSLLDSIFSGSTLAQAFMGRLDSLNNTNAVGGLSGAYTSGNWDLGSIVPGTSFPNETFPRRIVLAMGSGGHNFGTVP